MNGIQGKDDMNRELINAFEEFLEQYAQDEIADAAESTRDALHLDWRDMFRFNPDLAEDFVNAPKHALPALRAAIHEYPVPVPGVEEHLGTLDARVHGVDTPESTVSNLRNEAHRGKYMGVRGQVSLATQVKPKLMTAMFRCERCSSSESDMTVGPIPQTRGDMNMPHECPSCERQGPFSLIEDQCEYQDHQIVELTDPPGENPGQSGNVVPVHFYGDIAGNVKPGDRVRVNGIVDTEPVQVSGGAQASRRKDWYLRGHAIDEEETAFDDVEPERVDEITELAERDDSRELLVDSFAPDILTGERGDKHKLAVLLSLCGGNSATGRDDINVFFVGAPGTGKSAYLKRAKELAPKAIEASGKGATAAGLTATATKSDTTGKWMLDAGALVLASGGVACIDEFDKMADSARQSMHEAMENQEVPINKAGINTTLTTETTVLAAANPKDGSFNRFDALGDQLNIGSPLLSRFDLIFGVSDSVDEDRDAMIARHQHNRTDDPQDGPLEDDLISEYIAYARQNVHPSYESDEPRERLVEYYVDIREESDGEEDTAVPVTPRMNDALRRLAQASARLDHRETITMADAETAIELMNLRLGDTALDEHGDIDGGKMEGHTQKDRKDRILEACDEARTPAEVASITGVSESVVESELEALAQAGRVMEPRTGAYRRV
jgi:replicative DNA helicase Mcm